MHEGTEEVVTGRPVHLVNLGGEVGAKRHRACHPRSNCSAGDIGIKVGDHERKIVAPLLDAVPIALGMPTISEMTKIGSGTAKSQMKSIAPWRRPASSSV